MYKHLIEIAKNGCFGLVNCKEPTECGMSSFCTFEWRLRRVFRVKPTLIDKRGNVI